MAEYAIEYPERSLDGVRRKRAFACLIDALIIAILVFLVGIVVSILGVLTFGLAWLLFGAITPIVAIVYAGMGIGGRDAATLGMRAMGIRCTLERGGKPEFLHGAAHIILFYLSVSILTPFILLVTLFNERKRFLHDMLTNIRVVNA